MKFYVTSSIAYTNAPPHIGFAMELLQADVLARHARAQGKSVIFSTGTDEHGGKIAEKAAEQSKTPKQFVDEISQTFRDLAVDLNISNDRFVRTTDEGHEKRAQIIWDKLKDDIYKSTYTGWYCQGCEAYVTEPVCKANNGVCPHHNRKYEKLEEENYFFKLSSYIPQVKQAIESDELRVIPISRKHEILKIIEQGVEDISITRPKEKLSWGIPVPGDETQVMYVWVEALTNYLTVLGYPEHNDFKEFWPANYHIIGKDISKFHAIIWPAMLTALGLPLPGTIYAHGFITVDGQKMSKSIGNVVAPKDVIDKYGVDVFRYFFLRHIPSYDDGDFNWDRLEEVYNGELANELGNLVSRTTALITKHLGGKVKLVPAKHDIARYERAIENCRFDKALEEVWKHVRSLNQYIDEQKPWVVAKEGDNDHLSEILSYQAATLLQIADLLVPFLPDTSAKIKGVFEGDQITPIPQLFPRREANE
ncbi:MAG: methionine--tRNA ligase [bacterium]|nr:methionine--tRNA ligase [bacterium]